MSCNGIAALVVAGVIALPATCSSSQGVASGAGDPADPNARVPPVRYESAFAGYRRSGEVEVGSWRDSNDRVGRLGGWRTYGREAIGDETKASDAQDRKEPSPTPTREQRH